MDFVPIELILYLFCPSVTAPPPVKSQPASSPVTSQPVSSPTLTPSGGGGGSTDSNSGGDSNLGAIIGGTAGALCAAIVVAMTIIVVLWLLTRRTKEVVLEHEYDYIEPPKLPPSRMNTIPMTKSDTYNVGGPAALEGTTGFAMERNAAYSTVNNSPGIAAEQNEGYYDNVN